MIQLVFDASTAAQALGQNADRDRLQPARGRRARRLGRRQARARRRHPSRRASGRRLARELLRRGALSRQLGRGRRRLRRHARPDVRRPPGRADDPERPAAARAEFPWIAFEGRWGELQPAFFNGPTGPNLKTQWTEPIGGRRAGATGATRCRQAARSDGCDRLLLRRRRRAARARSSGSSTVRSSSPASSRALVLLVSSSLARTTGARRRRSASPAVAPGDRSSRPPRGCTPRGSLLFVGIGARLAADLAARDAAAGARPARHERPRGPDRAARAAGSLVFVVLAIGTSLTLLALGLVQAATARALVEIDAGRPSGRSAPTGSPSTASGRSSARSWSRRSSSRCSRARSSCSRSRSGSRDAGR